jgi:hypothetical protein
MAQMAKPCPMAITARETAWSAQLAQAPDERVVGQTSRATGGKRPLTEARFDKDAEHGASRLPVDPGRLSEGGHAAALR